LCQTEKLSEKGDERRSEWCSVMQQLKSQQTKEEKEGVFKSFQLLESRCSIDVWTLLQEGQFSAEFQCQNLFRRLNQSIK